MEQKKIIILGGTLMQIPVIEYAKQQGYYVITADYLPQNPGHKISDEYHNVSTTDLDAVYELASELKIDGILAYASDPAAPTAAYVSEKLNLKGNKFDIINMMSNKTLFRSFLKRNNFPIPEFCEFSNYNEFQKYITQIDYPTIVKPIDSSGSKGVTRLTDKQEDLNIVFNYAMEFSRSQKIIVEKYIDGPQIHGDGFIYNGELVFVCLGDQNFDDSFGNIVPCYTLFPSKENNSIIENCKHQVEHFIKLSGFQIGGINIEIRIDKHSHIPYIIEIGARNGGHFVPDTIKSCTDFDFVKASVDCIMGENFDMPELNYDGYSANLILHSQGEGIFNGITISPKLEKHIVEKHIYKSIGDKIEKYKGSNTAIGVLVVKFNSREEAEELLNNSNNYYNIKLT